MIVDRSTDEYRDLIQHLFSLGDLTVDLRAIGQFCNHCPRVRSDLCAAGCQRVVGDHEHPFDLLFAQNRRRALFIALELGIASPDDMPVLVI